MLKKCCPWLFGADAAEGTQEKEQKKGLLTDEESNMASEDVPDPVISLPTTLHA